MGNTTQHDWDAYREKCHSEHVEWLRNLTTADSLALYQDLHRLVRAQQDGSPGWKRLEQNRWEEKLSIRHKLHEAFSRLDDTNGK